MKPDKTHMHGIAQYAVGGKASKDCFFLLNLISHCFLIDRVLSDSVKIRLAQVPRSIPYSCEASFCSRATYSIAKLHGKIPTSSQNSFSILRVPNGDSANLAVVECYW